MSIETKKIICLRTKGGKKMPEYNQDVRQAIRQARIKQYEIAVKIGCHPSTLCSWLHIGELSPERKNQILKAIDEIKNQ